MPPHILVVDDQDAIRNLLVRLLNSQGHQVQVATGGREALDFPSRQSFDLALLDLKSCAPLLRWRVHWG